MQTSVSRFKKGSVHNWQERKKKRDGLKQLVLNGRCYKEDRNGKRQMPWSLKTKRVWSQQHIRATWIVHLVPFIGLLAIKAVFSVEGYKCAWDVFVEWINDWCLPHDCPMSEWKREGTNEQMNRPITHVNEDYSSTYLEWLVEELYGIMHLKSLAPCLTPAGTQFQLVPLLRFPQVYWSTGTATARYHRLGGLNNRCLFSQSEG